MGAKTFIRGLKTSVNTSRAINLLANRANPYAEHRSHVLFLKSTKKNTRKMDIEIRSDCIWTVSLRIWGPYLLFLNFWIQKTNAFRITPFYSLLTEPGKSTCVFENGIKVLYKNFTTAFNTQSLFQNMWRKGQKANVTRYRELSVVTGPKGFKFKYRTVVN